MSVNKVILVGHLGRDPETRYTSGGQAVCNFTLATNEVFKDRAGERQKRTEWHRIVLWGKQAELAQQYLKKGNQVYIEGRIQSRPLKCTPPLHPMKRLPARRFLTRIFPFN